LQPLSFRACFHTSFTSRKVILCRWRNKAIHNYGTRKYYEKVAGPVDQTSAPELRRVDQSIQPGLGALIAKPNNSCTIWMPVSLRWCSGSSGNDVRFPSGMSVRLRQNPQSTQAPPPRSANRVVRKPRAWIPRDKPIPCRPRRFRHDYVTPHPLTHAIGGVARAQARDDREPAGTLHRHASKTRVRS
jgi:hypothetical protein